MFVKILQTHSHIIFKASEKPKTYETGVTPPVIKTLPQGFSQAQAQALKNNTLVQLSFKGRKGLTLEEFFKEIETNPAYEDFKSTLEKNPRIRKEMQIFEYPPLTLKYINDNLKIAEHIKKDFPEMYRCTESERSRLGILTHTCIREKDYISLRDNNLLEVNPQKPYYFFQNLFNQNLKGRDLTNNINFLKELREHPALQNTFGEDKIYAYVETCLEKKMPKPFHPSQNKKAVEILQLLEKKEYEKVLGKIYKDTKINWFFQNDFDVNKVKKVFDYLKKPKISSEEMDFTSRVFDYNSLKKLSENFERLKSNGIKKPVMLMGELGSKNIQDLFEIFNYLKNSETLSELNIDLKEIISHFLKNNSNKANRNLSIQELKPELKKLEKLKEIGGEKVFKAAGSRILKNLLKGVKNAADFNPEAVEFLRKLGEIHPEILASIERNIPTILKDKTLKKPLLERNLKLLERILTTDEFGGLRYNKDLKKRHFLTYQGDLEKLCKTYEAKMGDKQYWWEKLKVEFLNNHKVSIENIKGNLGSKTEVFDKTIKLLCSEEKTREVTRFGQYINYYDIKDIKNNTDYSISGLGSEYISKNDLFTLQEMITKTKDAANNIISEEVLETADIDGVYNIYKTDKNGNVETLSHGIQNEKGIVIEKKLPSLNGETTYFNYFQNPKKTFEEFHYVIKDKNENILAQRHTSLKQLSENAFENIVDGIKYDIKHNTDGSVEIYNHNSQKTTKFALSYQEDFKTELQNLVKTLPADELERFPGGIGRIESSAEGTGYMRYYEKILQTDSERFTLLHEAGHGKKFPTADGMLCQKADEFFAQNSEFVKIYKEEMALIDKKLPPRIKKIIYYFLEKQKSKDGFTDPIRETAAEINAIINGPIFCKDLKGRTHFIQRYLPRTIAFVLKHRP